jgi:hypothetical protein
MLWVRLCIQTDDILYGVTSQPENDDGSNDGTININAAQSVKNGQKVVMSVDHYYVLSKSPESRLQPRLS